MESLDGNTGGGNDQRGMSSMTTRFHTVLHSAMSSGQYEKVAQGAVAVMFS